MTPALVVLAPVALQAALLLWLGRRREHRALRARLAVWGHAEPTPAALARARAAQARTEAAFGVGL